MSGVVEFGDLAIWRSRPTDRPTRATAHAPPGRRRRPPDPPPPARRRSAQHGGKLLRRQMRFAAIFATLLVPLLGINVPRSVLRSFTGYSLQNELAIAHVAAQSDAIDAVLTADAAKSESGYWVWHADSDVCIALVDNSGEATLSLFYRPAEQLTIFAIRDSGCHARLGSNDDDDEPPEDAACEAGGGSYSSNVLHLPASDALCPELLDCIEHLENIGTGMPLTMVRKSGVSTSEGLVDVVLSRADVHLAPPLRFFPQQPDIPLEVLCTFDLLLTESGDRSPTFMANASTYHRLVRDLSLPSKWLRLERRRCRERAESHHAAADAKRHVGSGRGDRAILFACNEGGLPSEGVGWLDDDTALHLAARRFEEGDGGLYGRV